MSAGMVIAARLDGDEWYLAAETWDEYNAAAGEPIPGGGPQCPSCGGWHVDETGQPTREADFIIGDAGVTCEGCGEVYPVRAMREEEVVFP